MYDGSAFGLRIAWGGNAARVLTLAGDRTWPVKRALAIPSVQTINPYPWGAGPQWSWYPGQ